MTEQWRDVPGYDGLYQVSDRGRVYRVDRGHHMAGMCNHDGYRIVTLCKDGKQCKVFVHRLVAAVFVPNPDNKPEVNHKDGNKANNMASNLEWCTRLENVRHACATGLRSKEQYRARALAASMKTRRKVRRSDGAIFDSVTEAAQSIGKTCAAVYNVMRGLRLSAGGYSFEYLEV